MAAELGQISAPSPAQALPVMAQPGPMVGNGRRFISVPWVLCTMHPSAERVPLKGAGAQLHSTALIQVLAGLRGQGIAGPWGPSIRFFRGGQGPTCFPWSPIPGQLQCIRRSSGLDPLHPFPGTSPMCPAELSAEQCQAAVLSLEHRAQGRQQGQGRTGLPIQVPTQA